MKLSVLTTVIALTATSVFAGDRTKAEAEAEASALAGALSNTEIEFGDSPSLTYGAFAQISSMANDRCGRVAIGIPFSAYTCNIIMEAEAVYELTFALRGNKQFAAEAAIRHVVDNDRTMRTTFRRMGVIE